jgi:hypothetical protein
LTAEQPQLDGVVSGSGGKTGGIAGTRDGPNDPRMSLGNLSQQLKRPFVICARHYISSRTFFFSGLTLCDKRRSHLTLLHLVISCNTLALGTPITRRFIIMRDGWLGLQIKSLSRGNVSPGFRTANGGKIQQNTFGPWGGGGDLQFYTRLPDCGPWRQRQGRLHQA